MVRWLGLASAIGAAIILTWMPYSALPAGHGSAVTTTCPTSGLTASSGTVSLTVDCTITGAVSLSGTASLRMTGHTLSIAGNITLHNQANIIQNGGIFAVPQTPTAPITFNIFDSSFVKIDNASITTTNSSSHVDLTINANDKSGLYFINSTLDTTSGNWILANFFGSASLHSKGVTNTPTEIYPNSNINTTDATGIYLENSTVGTVWIPFPPSTTAGINVGNRLDGSGNFTFAFGRTSGFPHFIYTKNSKYRLGLGSYSGSTLTVVGGGAGSTTDINVVFGYYVVNNTTPVTIASLPVGSDVSTTVGSDRTLTLTHLNMNPFSWQVYASNTVSDPVNRLVTISDSIVNEVGALSKGNIKILRGTNQLAAFGAFGGVGSSITTVDTDIWNLDIIAKNGATVNLQGTTKLHGNPVISVGTGSNITIDGTVVDNCNGASTQTNCTPVGGYPPNAGGVPLCNSAMTLHQSATYTTSAGGTITGNPASISCP